ncbi:MAG TPA: glycosyltransferase [Bryobacteraceae bacterium]|jgi:glycosyltransferase involved in cell wall biosynthesis|nr:glycosyltransferase [Bryobacteraceae bacterium]
MSAPAPAFSPAIAQPARKPWRVLILAHAPDADRSAYQLAHRLRSRQWQVIVADAKNAPLAKLLKRDRPHILHCHAPKITFNPRTIAALLKIPVRITTLQAGTSAFGRLLQKLSDASIANCPEEMRGGPGKVAMIRPGVDLVRFRPDRELRRRTREALGLGRSFAWLSASPLDPREDHHSLIRGFARVAAQQPDAALVLAGDGAMRGELAELAASLNIAPRVLFLGTRSDIPALMNAADAYVSASPGEALPPVLLEAGAAHLPVVATDAQSTASMLAHGVSGLAAPPSNPEALADTMLHLMTLPDQEREQLARNAFAHVLRHHDLEQIAGQWEQLYETLLARKGVQP